jgi:nitric oxide dioxygenase
VNPAAIRRIQASRDTLLAGVEPLSEAFYELLFATYPHMRSIFPADMTRQRQHLASAITLVARNVERLDMLSEPLRGLGARHIAYGASNDMYPAVRDTLLEAMAKVAGDAWSEQAHRDWHEALDEVITLMLDGARAAHARLEAAALEPAMPPDDDTSHAH